VDHVEPQPTGIISQLTGFNLNVQVYMTCTPIATMDLAYGIDEVFDLNRQKLQAVKQILDGAPRELLLTPGSQPGEFEGQNDRTYLAPALDYSTNSPVPRNTELQGDERRYLQYEIQKANIYASQLGTRSYIVEKYWNTLDAHEAKMKYRENSATSPSTQSSPVVMTSGHDGLLGSTSGNSGYDVVESHMSTERENIVKDLLRVLGSISQVNMEPNGGSFVSHSLQRVQGSV
jgi:hypothetical protein